MTIFVVGGGTGGHLFPAIALGQEFIGRGYQVHLVTDTRCKSYISSNLNLKTSILSLGFMRSGLLATALLIGRCIRATFKSIAILREYNASIVIGFGGYPTFPTLLAAKILRIPIMLHEQNCFLGKVNKIFTKSAVVLALNFAETSNLPTGCSDKIVVTGNPVRPEIRLAYKERNFAEDELRILVIGGSQSAKIFSSLIPDTITLLRAQKPELKISIIQQASTLDHTKLHEAYRGINHEVQEFFQNMPTRYLDSDLVICRAGASTIAELIYLGQPAILIPFPFAAEDHQFFNASVLANKSAAWCYRQQDLTAEILVDKIIAIVETPDILRQMSRILLQMRVDSERILADTVIKIIAK